MKVATPKNGPRTVVFNESDRRTLRKADDLFDQLAYLAREGCTIGGKPYEAAHLANFGAFAHKLLEDACRAEPPAPVTPVPPAGKTNA